MRLSLAVLACLLTAPTSLAQLYPYRLVDLDAGGASGNPWGVAADGTAIAGNVSTNGFVWRDGVGFTFVTPLPGHTQTQAWALDLSGNACGSSGVASIGVQPLRAVRFLAGGATQDLGTLGGSFSTAREMNETGHIVGDATLTGAADWHAFLWRDGIGMVDLSPGIAEAHAMDVNESDGVTGCVGPAGFTAINRAFRWTPAAGLVDLGNPAGFKNSCGLGINAAGQVCGVATTPNGLARAWVRYTDGAGWQVLLPNAALSTAWKINDFGQIVGDTHAGGGSQLAAVYTDGFGPQALNDLIDPTLGWTLMAAHDINERGQIVGYGRDPSGLIHGYRLDPNFFDAYGVGCNGTGGQRPALFGHGVPTAGQVVQLMMAEGTPGGVGLLFLSPSAGNLPLGQCTWWLGAPFGAPIPFLFDSNRQARLSSVLPASVSGGLSIYFQVASIDPGAPNGSYALSNGLEMILP